MKYRVEIKKYSGETWYIPQKKVKLFGFIPFYVDLSAPTPNRFDAVVILNDELKRVEK